MPVDGSGKSLEELAVRFSQATKELQASSQLRCFGVLSLFGCSKACMVMLFANKQHTICICLSPAARS